MKKGMFTIILLALTVINLIFNIIIVFTMLPSLKNTNNLVNKVATIIDLDNAKLEEENDVVAIGDLEVVDVNSTVTLKPDENGKLRYAAITLTVSLNKKDPNYEANKAIFDSKTSIVISIINTVVSEYGIDEVNSKRQEIKDRILLDLKDTFGDKFVYEISFSQFNMQ
ncbi:MAG: flagellar basal body-associated FliL family protein [Lachnospiraceae bacterium]|nr:flagellar basal body-associated FliL family protein [Lachnospiraceae bacterium]